MFALNHITVPDLHPSELLSLARHLGCDGVELRVDIPQHDLTHARTLRLIKEQAERWGVRIFSFGPFHNFNHWNARRRLEADEIIECARLCGAQAITLLPSFGEDKPAPLDTPTALRALQPILQQNGIQGFIEPLGYPHASVRMKKDVVKIIKSLPQPTPFRLLHDTFHHALSGEQKVFPEATGLVHICSVADPAVSLPEIDPAHRVLLGAEDRLGSIDQFVALRDGGYQGSFSFEALAEIEKPRRALTQSMDYIRTVLAA